MARPLVAATGHGESERFVVVWISDDVGRIERTDKPLTERELREELASGGLSTEAIDNAIAAARAQRAR